MNTSDVLKYGHMTVLKTISGLSDGAMEIGGVCGWWSTREIMAHLTSYELVLTDVLAGLLGGGDNLYLQAFLGERFNDDQVARRKHQSTAAVVDEYTTAHERNMALVAQIPAETARLTGTFPWYGAEYALDDFIVYTFYGHKREHSAQIAVFRDRSGQ